MIVHSVTKNITEKSHQHGCINNLFLLFFLLVFLLLFVFLFLPLCWCCCCWWWCLFSCFVSKGHDRYPWLLIVLQALDKRSILSNADVYRGVHTFFDLRNLHADTFNKFVLCCLVSGVSVWRSEDNLLIVIPRQTTCKTMFSLCDIRYTMACLSKIIWQYCNPVCSKIDV